MEHKRELYIGIMSGTSMDGIDLVLAEFDGNQAKVIAAAGGKWPEKLLKTMHGLCTPGDNETDKSGAVSVEISRVFADGVNQLLKKADVRAEDVAAIGSHGQTVRHRPELGFTVQLGSGALLAHLTGIDVICDFRSADMAAGGQGAPLVPAFHDQIFRNPEKLRFIINIGGISNISVLDHSSRTVLGFDTGPGNTLMDLLVRNTWNEPYDKNAVHAGQGTVCIPLLNRLMQHPYIKKDWPKSTGRETFTGEFTDQCVRETGISISPEDLLRTLAAFTADSIADAVMRVADGRSYESYICGGGAHNPLLMSDLETRLQGCEKFGSTELLGADPDYVEALAFAWLARQFVRRQPGNLPAATGASRSKILGCLYPAS